MGDPSIAPSVIATDSSTLSLPRILCLHGGGVTAQIFHLQCRGLLRPLTPHFRLVFADGPYSSDLHEMLTPFYGHLGSARRWSIWKEEHELVDTDECIAQMETCMVRAMEGDKEGTGEWVGLMGFSQGAKLSMSILLENQLRRDEGEGIPGFAGVHWRFGIVLAGRALPYSLSDRTKSNPHFDPPGQMPRDGVAATRFTGRLETPTLHVHGLRDQGIEMQRQLFNNFCGEGSAKLIEWDEGHRVPFKPADVKVVGEGILEVAMVGFFSPFWNHAKIGNNGRLIERQMANVL